jgi:leader peptidase (prepilin peptidase)/N-methyltransferase
MFDPIFSRETWSAVPFHFWSVVFFVFGCMWGSFLNVCIHRLPRDMSVWSPPSHCPHCGYAIPWYRNVPLVTWVMLRGRCANCRAPISPRYLLVELLTGLLFLGCWLALGNPARPLASLPLALVFCGFSAGLVVATFIDFEHFIIPDEITLGGIGAGFVASLLVPQMQFLVPEMHGTDITATGALWRSFLGIATGGGVMYAILRAGKLAFGRQRLTLAPDSPVIFTETTLQLPDKEIPYEELFYRQSDRLELHAKSVKVFARVDDPAPRVFENVRLCLSPAKLTIGLEEFNPETLPRLEVITDEIHAPREAMGLGDVKFMAAIGAFLGWQAVLFCVMASALVGSVVGGALVLLRRRDWSSKIPYGPYIALAALGWLFGGKELAGWWISGGMLR